LMYVLMRVRKVRSMMAETEVSSNCSAVKRVVVVK
jgi:hypothetical protein